MKGLDFNALKMLTSKEGFVQVRSCAMIIAGAGTNAKLHYGGMVWYLRSKHFGLVHRLHFYVRQATEDFSDDSASPVEQSPHDIHEELGRLMAYQS